MNLFRDHWRHALLASALAGLVGLSLLVSGCGGSTAGGVAQLGSATTAAKTNSANAPTTSSQATNVQKMLAFSRCVRQHGVPNFPDPDSQGQLPALTQQDLGVTKQTSLAAQQACESTLARGGSTATPQQRQEKLAFGLKVAQCLRAHGYPMFPDPTGSSQALPPGIDPSSPQFEAAQTTCEKQEQPASLR
ncbi:MAG TPA: hypothetical protein VG652_02115 [Gaiellaceae bacterium]|nr:hypothetical protein [Gaiellaceae bacterium]